MRYRFLSLILSVLCVLTFVLPLPTGAAAAAFSDVPQGSWYESTVRAMTEAGRLTGYPDGTFRPEAAISAAEFVSVVARCAGLQGRPNSQSPHWAARELQAALDAGWYDWDELPPTGEKYDQPIARQLAVKILMRALLPEARGDYASQASKIRDLSELDGRYYDAVFAAYAAGVTKGDDSGCFHAKDSLTRAEACAIIQRAADRSPLPSGGGETTEPQPPAPAPQPIQGGVSQNGRLSVSGTSLCNEQGQPVVLRGMSSHGIHWFPQFATSQAIGNTAQFGANLFRVAMYTGEGGYLSQPEAVKAQATAAVDAAIAHDMYVILDWHILSDGNPLSHIDEARAFFSEMAERYGDEPAVLFEICNEPNGNVSWERDIRPYAVEMVRVIREKAPQSIILIGSGTWSQDIHDAAAHPLEGDNLMYTCHFYAGTHGQWLRDRIDSALKAGLPIFISEWGTSAADGSGGVFLDASKEWLDFLDERGISWANWSLCDKNETSAALKPGTSAQSAWTENDLSESGRFVFSRFGG